MLWPGWPRAGGWQPKGSNRVIRGGSWNNNGRNCWSANRNNNGPDVGHEIRNGPRAGQGIWFWNTKRGDAIKKFLEGLDPGRTGRRGRLLLRDQNTIRQIAMEAITPAKSASKPAATAWRVRRTDTAPK